MRIGGTSCQNFFKIKDFVNFGSDLQGSETLTSSLISLIILLIMRFWAQNTSYYIAYREVTTPIN